MKIDGEFLISQGEVKDTTLRPITEHLGFFFYPIDNINVFWKKEKNNQIIIFGDIYDPRLPDANIEQISNDLLKSENTTQFLNTLFSLAGNYVVVRCWESNIALVADPVSFRKIYYTNIENQKYIASSSASILANKNGFLPNKKFTEEKKGYRVGTHSYLPLGLTNYDQISHLLPNHYLLLPEKKSIRFYPKTQKRDISYRDSIDLAVNILKNSADYYSRKYSEIFIATTAGYDSRLSLAAFSGTPHKTEKVQGFTFLYPYLNEKNSDIRLAREICGLAGIKHNLIKVDDPHAADHLFVSIYGKNVPIVVSLVSDISRVFYRIPKWGITPDILIAKENLTPFLEFKEEIRLWLETVNFPGYDALDLLYWENRVSRWAAKGFSGSDSVIKKINIFNCRQLLDIFITIPKQKRISGQFCKDLICEMNPDLLKIPFNPPDNMKAYIKKIVLFLPCEDFFKWLYLALKTNRNRNF